VAEPGALRRLLGGSIRACGSGGAPLTDQVFDFYVLQGVPLLQGYGLTEASPDVCVTRPGRRKRGTVGHPLPGVEVRIAEDGEVLTRGPHVMLGYYRNPQATREAIRDGWLHTGDLGELDGERHLRITGRKKEMLVTTGGKKVPPILLESLLSEDPLIRQALAVGDGRDFVAALIVPDFGALREELAAQSNNPQPTDEADDRLLARPEIAALYERRVRERLADLSSYEQVRKFALTSQPFAVESGELTPKSSLRRRVIEARRAEEINALYQRATE
jgi:long-chain acyl-CoA synthetase